MKRDLTDLLCCPDCQSDLSLRDETPSQPEVETGTLTCVSCDEVYPILRGVPRFVSSDQYVGSFSYEWNRWNRVQLDEANGGNESETTFAEKSGFRPEELRGKLVLDVGCGAGRFLDVASRWGARAVGVDLSFAVEASHKNLGQRPNVAVIQADVFRLPFRTQTFDAIFSLGVLHHSRDTREAFLSFRHYSRTEETSRSGCITTRIASTRQPATSGASCSGRCRRGPCTRGRGCSSRCSRTCGSRRSCRACPGCICGGCCRSTRTQNVTGESWTRSTGITPLPGQRLFAGASHRLVPRG